MGGVDWLGYGMDSSWTLTSEVPGWVFYSCCYSVFGFLFFVCFAVGSLRPQPQAAVNVTCKCAFPFPAANAHATWLTYTWQVSRTPPINSYSHHSILLHITFARRFGRFVKKPTVWQEVARRISQPICIRLEHITNLKRPSVWGGLSLPRVIMLNSLRQVESRKNPKEKLQAH